MSDPKELQEAALYDLDDSPIFRPVLALDMATSTGWALRSCRGEVLSGVESFPKKSSESDGMRFLRFRRWLREMLSLNGPWTGGILAYEAAHHRGGAATRLAVGLVSHAQEIAAREGLNVTSVHTATLKKHATGKGNADKVAMVEAAAKRWPNQWALPLEFDVMAITESDRADALNVLAWALDEIGDAA